MSKIKEVLAREIINSKGFPSIETTVVLSDGKTGVASCPSGTSVGNYEASELHDHDETRYQGRGVLKAVENVQNLIGPNLVGIDVVKQQVIDKVMIDLDGTQNKSRLGANAILSVSIAVAKAAAKVSVLPLFLYLREYIKKENLELRIPTPAFNTLNGGQHANMNVDFQEFLVIPASSFSYDKSLLAVNSIYNSLKQILKDRGLSILVGDEGGFGPVLDSNKEGLDLLAKAIEMSNFRLGFDVFLGLDVASDNIYTEGKYHLKDKSSGLSAIDLINFYKELAESHKLIYLEDPIIDSDWESWSETVLKVGNQTIIVGDDLIATNPYRLQTALDKKAVTGIIIKPNQIGTVIEAVAVVEVARAAGLKIIVSHRSGETNDDFIADFAVAMSSDYVKFGAPVRGERVAKYNRLLQIEKQLKNLG
ncbi:MAG: phosphopyruvate hydratase [Candidatus Levybacteria bacterium RBG_16_35_6]|nr:MAG: phosphopyruvate hydratase [Candidatus Levybacteria bacterium RBG_16_35_6]